MLFFSCVVCNDHVYLSDTEQPTALQTKSVLWRQFSPSHFPILTATGLTTLLLLNRHVLYESFGKWSVSDLDLVRPYAMESLEAPHF